MCGHSNPFFHLHNYLPHSDFLRAGGKPTLPPTAPPSYYTLTKLVTLEDSRCSNDCCFQRDMWLINTPYTDKGIYMKTRRTRWRLHSQAQTKRVPGPWKHRFYVKPIDICLKIWLQRKKQPHSGPRKHQCAKIKPAFMLVSKTTQTLHQWDSHRHQGGLNWS